MSTSSNDAYVEHDIYRMLTKTFLLLDDCDRRLFAEYGLTTRQFWALQHLYDRQECSMVDLSRVLFTDKSNVTGIVDRLESLHLAMRTADVHDRRVILIKLTPEGHRLRETVSEQHSTQIHDLLHVVCDAPQGSLLDYLEALHRNIEAYLEHTQTAQAS